jgi:RHS repeat-associated protein
VVALTDESGQVVQSYEYDSFGKIVAQMGCIRNPFTYTGREYDEETSLYYFRARYYDPRTGKFLTRDPIGFAGGDTNVYRYVDSVGKPLLDTNRYRYVGNDPVNWVDPFGLYRSHWLLRATVPGQIAWDEAMTAYEEGDYLSASLAEIILRF